MLEIQSDSVVELEFIDNNELERDNAFNYGTVVLYISRGGGVSVIINCC